MQAFGTLLKGVDACYVECRHVAKTQYYHVPKPSQVLGGLRQLFGCPKEKRTVNAEDGHVRGNVLVLEDVRLPILQVFARDRLDGRRFSDAVDIEKCCQGHPNSYGYGQVSENGQGECREPDGNVSLRQAKDCANLPPLPHVVGHHEQDR